MKESQVNFKTNAQLKGDFKKLCKKNNTTMELAFNVFMETCHNNSLNPAFIDTYLSQNVNTSILKYHNYTVSFLKTFEETFINRLELYHSSNNNFYRDILDKITVILKKNNIEKEVINEVLFNTQLLIDLEDSNLGKSIFEKNYNAILKKEKENVHQTG